MKEGGGEMKARTNPQTEGSYKKMETFVLRFHKNA